MNPELHRTLSHWDAFCHGVDALIRTACELGCARKDVADYVAATRNLTRDHADGVVNRYWPVFVT